MLRVAAFAVALLVAPLAAAQDSAGLNIAGAEFTFAQAVREGVSKGGPFFVLVLPPAIAGLSQNAPADIVRLRSRAAAKGARFMVCQRDVQNGNVPSQGLIPGVITVRGWPPANQPDAFANGGPLLVGENPAEMPVAGDQIRKIRNICS